MDDTFRRPAELTMFANNIYCKFGKLVTLATAFEDDCRVLAAHVGIKNNRTILNSEEELQAFCEQLEKTPLYKNIKTAFPKNSFLFTELNPAREKRNLIAHEMSKSFFSDVDTNPFIKSLETEIPACALALATALNTTECLLFFMNNKELPPNRHSEVYIKKITSWVDDNIQD